MKRVFHVVTHFDLGGAERVAVNIARSQTEGIEYHLVEVTRGRGHFSKVFVDELREAGIKYHRSWFPVLVSFHYMLERVAAWLFPLWFYFLFRKYRPDVIHSHTEIPDWGVSRFFRLFPRLTHSCKLVRTIHNTRLWTGMEHTGQRAEQLFQKKGANVAISKSVVDNYERIYGQRPPIISNGVEPVAQKKSEYVIGDKINILFAGRFERQKGISTLVDIVESMQDDSRYFFHIFGDGSLRTDIQRIANCRNAQVYPPLFALSSFMASFDYLLMPSEFEGLSMLSIEASMNGLPVVANDCPGLKDTLPEDWPLKATDNRLSDYLHLLRDVLPVANRDTLVAHARSFVNHRFGIRRMQLAYEALYLGGQSGENHTKLLES